MSAEEPGPSLTGADLESLMAEHGLDLDPPDREPILSIARFLQRAAANLARCEDDTAEVRS